MAIVLFILGNSGTGKTQLAKKFVKKHLNQSWCMLDKDTCGNVLSRSLMQVLGLNPNDRDSPAYIEKIRDLEYQTCLDIINDQLQLGVNVVVPGPWTKEINSGKLFSVKAMNFPRNTILKYIYLDLSPEKMYNRIVSRNNPRDKWKLDNWEDYKKKIVIPKTIKDKNILVLSDQFSHYKQLQIITEICEI